jgi:hypothetical protein
MDNPAIVHDIYAIAKLAAEKQIKAEHLAGDLPAFVQAPAQR